MPNVLGKAAAFAVVAAALLASATAWAQTKSLQLLVDKATASVGDSILVQVELLSSDDRVIGIAASRQITLQPAGTQSSVTIVNGKMTSKTMAQYRFVPQEPGEYIIGPATVQSGGAKISSNSVKVTVQAGGGERLLQFQSAVRPRRVYVGQPFAAAVTAIYGSDMRPVGWNPAMADGIVDMLGQDKSQQIQSTVQIDGKVYSSLTLSRWLYAATPGVKKLAGGRLEFDVAERQRRRTGFPFAGFDPFGMRTIRQASELPQQTITVRDLPPLPAGKNFLGAVGSLTAGWAQVEKHNNQLRAVMVLQGPGAAPAPHLESWVESGWRFYPDKPELNYGTRDGNIWLTLKTPVIIVPVNDPPTAVPAWFDPSKGEYVSVPLPLQPREIAPGPAAAGEVAQRVVAATASAAAQQRQLVVTPDGVLAASLTTALASQATAVAGGIMLFGWAAPLLTKRLRRRPSVERLLNTALAIDDYAAWSRAAQALHALPQMSAEQRAILEAINAALYAPSFQSPAQRVRELTKAAAP